MALALALELLELGLVLRRLRLQPLSAGLVLVLVAELALYQATLQGMPLNYLIPL
jgi:hypothetical protein